MSILWVALSKRRLAAQTSSTQMLLHDTALHNLLKKVLLGPDAQNLPSNHNQSRDDHHLIWHELEISGKITFI
jgi:hypothetical protein